MPLNKHNKRAELYTMEASTQSNCRSGHSIKYSQQYHGMSKKKLLTVNK